MFAHYQTGRINDQKTYRIDFNGVRIELCNNPIPLTIIKYDFRAYSVMKTPDWNEEDLEKVRRYREKVARGEMGYTWVKVK